MESRGNTYDQKGLVGVGHQSIHQSAVILTQIDFYVKTQSS